MGYKKLIRPTGQLGKTKSDKSSEDFSQTDFRLKKIFTTFGYRGSSFYTPTIGGLEEPHVYSKNFRYQRIFYTKRFMKRLKRNKKLKKKRKYLKVRETKQRKRQRR